MCRRKIYQSWERFCACGILLVWKLKRLKTNAYYPLRLIRYTSIMIYTSIGFIQYIPVGDGLYQSYDSSAMHFNLRSCEQWHKHVFIVCIGKVYVHELRGMTAPTIYIIKCCAYTICIRYKYLNMISVSNMTDMYHIGWDHAIHSPVSLQYDWTLSHFVSLFMIILYSQNGSHRQSE